MLHETLWELNSDLAEECLQHPFIRGLEAGTLDRDAFRRYVAQDAFFLRAFSKAYAIAFAKTDQAEHAQAFYELIGGVLEELKLHAAYADSLQIDLSDVQPYPATSAYTNFLLATAWQSQLAETLAAMVPCMKLYTFLGHALQPALRPDHPYSDWISTYSSSDFGSLCALLERLLDNTASDSPSVREAYRFAMRCELDFFTAPLESTR